VAHHKSFSITDFVQVVGTDCQEAELMANEALKEFKREFLLLESLGKEGSAPKLTFFT